MASFDKLFTGRFHLFPNAFFEIFLNDAESMFLMMYLIRKCNERNYYESLFECNKKKKIEIDDLDTKIKFLN